ncbi:tRNA (adenosine(37)-N6)-threonylcarbamoyltransferase complex dimerization subunit type 1 TsaB [Candidatus Methylocalor cossyra]|uniref:tRNA threonylcarbamoyladenosine biosynthesis protein TsaB n=1 Tax=Candidatus Methylocalor cossyra TaxID=3108543 RepID=A0ABM9NL95_9GAMM
MKLLAIETATEACSCALLIDGHSTERYALAPREHNRLILPMVQSLLEEAGLALEQLDALAFGRGPGAFTGLRIAAGVVQGLAFGADLPVVPVSTLAALAQQALDETAAPQVFACLDARMDEVYWGVYGRGGEGTAQLLGQELVAPAGAVPLPGEGWGVGLGSGWSRYGALLADRLGNRLTAVLQDRFPRAAAVARLGAEGFRLGRAVAAEQAVPVYLRDQVARQPRAE